MLNFSAHREPNAETVDFIFYFFPKFARPRDKTTSPASFLPLLEHNTKITNNDIILHETSEKNKKKKKDHHKRENLKKKNGIEFVEFVAGCDRGGDRRGRLNKEVAGWEGEAG